MIQASDEKIAMEMNQIGGADIKVNQANYDGMRGIIICSSFFYAVPIDFMVALIIFFIILPSFLSNMDHFIQLYLCVFFCSRRRNGIRL